MFIRRIVFIQATDWVKCPRNFPKEDQLPDDDFKDKVRKIGYFKYVFYNLIQILYVSMCILTLELVILLGPSV